MYRVPLAFLLIALLAGIAPIVQAQEIPGLGGGADPLTLSVSPEYPRPYQTVLVTMKSTLFDLAASTITITANGSVVAENSRTAQITLGGPGSKTTITAVARTGDGTTYQEQIVIAPASVAVVIEPESTAHPFYEGARLPAPEGRVRLIAMPDFRTAPGTKLPASSLVYTWRLGDRILEDQSGIGKNILTATAPVRYRDAAVSVTVSTQNRSLVAQTITTIAPATPVMRVYPSDPLLGIQFATALVDAFTLSGDEASFRAVPYFFKAAPSLVWTLNGTESGNTQDLTVRSSGGSGTAILTVIANTPGSGERADRRLTLRFGTGNTGIFGL